MIWRWMIAKWLWDEKDKLGQYRRYQFWDSLGEYRLRRKGRVKEMSFQLLKEKRGWKIRQRRVWNRRRVTWWTTWRRWDGGLFHKQEQNGRKIYLIFKTRGERRAIEGDTRGRLSTTMGREWKKSRGKKVDQFWDLYVRENLASHSLIYREPVERFKNRNRLLGILNYVWACR